MCFMIGAYVPHVIVSVIVKGCKVAVGLQKTNITVLMIAEKERYCVNNIHILKETLISTFDMSIFMPCSDGVHVCTCMYVVMFS